jgi:hypothetical protein
MVKRFLLRILRMKGRSLLKKNYEAILGFASIS